MTPNQLSHNGQGKNQFLKSMKGEESQSFGEEKTPNNLHNNLRHLALEKGRWGERKEVFLSHTSIHGGSSSMALGKPGTREWGLEAQRTTVLPVWPVGSSIAQQQRSQNLERARPGSQSWYSHLLTTHHYLVPHPDTMLPMPNLWHFIPFGYQVSVVLPPK